MAVIHGTNANDSRVGTSLADSIYGYNGNDTLLGASGSDTIYGGAGNDYLYSYASYHTSIYDTNYDVLYGEGGNDRLQGDLGADYLNGGTGADSMYGEGGGDTYVVDSLLDFAFDSGGSDWAYSTANLWAMGVGIEGLTLLTGAVSAAGNALNNRINGNGTDNFLNGVGGYDSLLGYGGDDSFFVSGTDALDEIDGGGGTDTLNLKDWTGPSGFSVNLAAGSYETASALLDGEFTSVENAVGSPRGDTISGTFGANRLEGRGGGDSINGIGGNDTIVGGAGNDFLYGGGGQDSLDGGADNDRLTGGFDKDVLIGGTGLDIFAFNAVSESPAGAGRDEVHAGGGAVAFEGVGAWLGDRIDVSGIDANVTAGNQAFVFGGTGTGHIWRADVGTTTRFYANVDADGEAEFQLDILDGAVLASAYTAADFIL